MHMLKQCAVRIQSIILAQLDHSEYARKRINARIEKLIVLDKEIDEYSETFEQGSVRLFVSLKPNLAMLATAPDDSRWCHVSLETEISTAGKTLEYDEIDSYISSLNKIKSAILALREIDLAFKVCVKTAEEAAAERAARLLSQQRECLVHVFHKKYAGIKPGYTKTMKYTAAELTVLAPLHTIKSDAWTQGANKYTVDQVGENVYITCSREV